MTVARDPAYKTETERFREVSVQAKRSAETARRAHKSANDGKIRFIGSS